jgi:hypothetical protein
MTEEGGEKKRGAPSIQDPRGQKQKARENKNKRQLLLYRIILIDLVSSVPFSQSSGYFFFKL